MLKNQYNTDKSTMVNRNDEGTPSQDTVLVFQGVLSGGLAPNKRTTEKCGIIRPTQKEAARDGTQE